MDEQGILILALVVLAAAILWAVFRYWYFYRREHMVCPRCGHGWKPPVLQMVFSVNAGGGKVLRCPRCGEKSYMEAVPDQKPPV